jgi:16S rRNA (adenine1518-N6/adenine1519-N6)-dimethyltransferase
MQLKHTPRKRFGQNFLHDQNVIAAIIRLIAPAADDQFIEIGPGQGALTLPLLEHLTRLDVVEIDRDLVAWWKTRAIEKLYLHESDALKTDFCELRADQQKPARLVGNLPYNISTPLLFHLLEFRECISDMHFMLQKEVVDRITADPGNKTYGRLSVMMQYYCQVEKLLTVRPGAFNPSPRVDSAIVRLVPYQNAQFVVNEKTLASVVSQAFSQRRKTLRNALKNLLSTEQISQLDIDPGCRAETLPLDAFVKLANQVDSRTIQSDGER